MSEAQAQYLGRIGDDCAALLGRDAAVLGVGEAKLGGTVRLFVRYMFAGKQHETIATGDTVVAAHAALRSQLVHDRLRIGFTSLVSDE
jgi:hypothetical protein